MFHFYVKALIGFKIILDKLTTVTWPKIGFSDKLLRDLYEPSSAVITENFFIKHQLFK
jgi:hypothetical protein